MKTISFVLALVSFSAVAQVSSPAPRKVCAVAYNSLDRQYSSKLHIADGSAIEDLNRMQVETGGNWDNRISKVAVAQGCTFIGYQYQDFNVNYHNNRDLDGFALVLSNESASRQYKTEVLGYENEKISSIKCFCR